MAAPAQAPSPAESETRDHCQSVTSVVELQVHLQLRKCEPRSIPVPEVELLDLHSSETTSQISYSGVPARTYRDEEFTGLMVTWLLMEEELAEHIVKGSPLSTGCDVYSFGLVIFAVLTNYYRFLNEAPRHKPRNTRSSRRPEVYTDLVLKRKSCTDGFLSKESQAHPNNGFVIDSSGETSLSLNASTETPIQHRPEGGLVYSGGPSHPAAAEQSGTTPLAKTPEPAWLVASSAANHMTGDVSQLTDCTPAPADLVVQVPNMGPRRVQDIGSLSTPTMSLQNVFYVPGLNKNLVSSSQLAKLGYTITLGPSECRVTKNDQVQTLVGIAHFTDDYLFELDFLRVPPSTN